VITYEEAIRIVDRHTREIGVWGKSVVGSTGLRLGEDLVALCDSPPFDNSAVDGYGRRESDLSATELPLAGEIRAGDDGSLEVPPGHTVRIFTGAPVPRDIAAVSMQEDCEESDGVVRFAEQSESGSHIRCAGSDFATGDVLARKGTVMNPPLVGLALSAGLHQIKHLARPRVAIVTTGDELESPMTPLGPGKIYNSNEGALTDAVRSMSERARTWQSPDDPERLRMTLGVFLNEDDVVITCGGVSVGAYDYLKDAFSALGVEQHFWSVAIKPGKPIYFGTKGKTLVFGLPGNPVSAMVTFYLFVRPALLKMAGHPDPWPKPIRARFEGEARKNPGRMEFLRGSLSQDGSIAVATGGQGSHVISALADADCLIHFPLESAELRSGDEVDITPLVWD